MYNGSLTVAVGRPVTRHPPHRSRRAALPHRALASGRDAQALRGIRMADMGCGPGAFRVFGARRHPGVARVRGSMPGSVAKFDFWGNIQRSDIRNSTTYRLPNFRKSNFATEPNALPARSPLWYAYAAS